MRFIDGEPLSRIITQLRAAKTDPDHDEGAKVVRGPETRQNGRDTTGESDTAPLATLTTKAPSSEPHFFRNAARIGREIADALDHAHQQGVVHRDVKPANIIIDRKGKPWIADFGLARIEDGARITMTGDLLGTLRYMSPEQVLSKREITDHRSDIYSLGITLYELLALIPAFDDDDRQALLRRIAYEDPAPLRRINANVPMPLQVIVEESDSKESE